MIKRKSTKKFYFSVEGETEKWYLEWLKDKINKSNEATYLVNFDISVQKNPLKRVKSLTITNKTEIWHLSDYESDEDMHVKMFSETMDNMKKAENLGKNIKYKFGYTNLTFDLWIILHKTKCTTQFSDRKQYIKTINKAYCAKFEDMHQFKHEDNFKECLDQLSLENVKTAIINAKDIMQDNKRVYIAYNLIKDSIFIEKILH